MRRGALLALALGLHASAVSAQAMRPFTTFRQLHGETRLRARLEYAAGALRVTPGRSTELYRMDLAFDDQRFLPVSDYDPARNTVSLGLRRGEESRSVSLRLGERPTQIDVVPMIPIEPAEPEAVPAPRKERKPLRAETAPAPEPKPRPEARQLAELEAELAALREELARLRKELEELRKGKGRE